MLNLFLKFLLVFLYYDFMSISMIYVSFHLSLPLSNTPLVAKIRKNNNRMNYNASLTNACERVSADDH